MNKFKNKFYKQILIATALFLSVGSVSAQEYRISDSEFSVYIKAPCSGLKTNMEDYGSSNTRFGAGIGLQYSYYLNTNWSISGALEYQEYRNKVLLNNFTDQYSLTDAEGDNIIFRSSVSLYREWQSVGMLNIPLKIQWETQGESTRLFAATGVQLGLPAYTTYTGTAYNLKTAGYFPQWNTELTSPLFMGFGDWGGKQQSEKNKLKLKPSYSLLFEIGMKHPMCNMQNLYVSAYMELGLNDIRKNSNSDQPLINYNVNNPTQLGYASVLNSSMQSSGLTYVGKVTTQGFGLKMRYAFGR